MILSKGFIKRNFVISIFVLLVLVSCGEKKQIHGKDLIPRDVMVEVLTDIHLVDGITNDVKYYRRYNPQDSIDLYGAVFSKHGVTKESFDRTLAEYAKYPYLLNEMYDEVLMVLNLMQDQLDKEMEEKKMKTKSDLS